MKRLLLCFHLVFSLAAATTFGQYLNDEPLWVQKMYLDNADITEVMELYEAYYKTHEFVKTAHTRHLQRLIHKITHDITGEYNPNLTDTQRRAIRANNEQFAQLSKLGNSRSTGSWTALGPYDWDHDAASRSYAPGAAHVYTVEQSLSNSDILYAGTATSGIWKTTDHGLNWMPLTYDKMDNQCYSLDIHPLNPDTVFADLLNNIYKTTDGGTTWLPTGDASFQTKSMNVYDILFHPTNHNIVFAGTQEGLYRTSDQGATWTNVLGSSTSHIQEIQVHPTNDSIWYVIEQTGTVTKFYRSNDIGATFVQQTTGWPSPSLPDENKRTEIAVTPASPDKIVALVLGKVNGGEGLYGIYTSTDKGSTWTFSCCGPQPGGLPDTSTNPPNINIMGYDDGGTDNGGQYYYDVALTVSPTNADSIFACGVQMWISADGGSSFSCPSKWSHPHKPDYIHADMHDINYYENNEIWAACDGGIFYSNDGGINFHRRMKGILGSDFWGFGVNYWGGDVMLGGLYHNGTVIKNGNTYLNDWLCTDGGDGDGGFTNVGIENQVYSQYNIKDLPNNRLTPIPTRDFAVKPYTTQPPGKSTNIAVHPGKYTHQYFGKDNCLYLTKDNHYNAAMVHCFPSNEPVADVEVSIANPNYIYVTTYDPGVYNAKKIHRSSDGGMNWTDITPQCSITGTTAYLPYDITLSDTDPLTLYMARLTFFFDLNYDGNKVFKSTDGGTTWTNLTTAALNGEQIVNIQYQRGSNEGLWIGTRRTVYYKSNNLADWMLCNTGLPVSTYSTKLVLNYRTQTIRNGSNRSVWEMPFVETSVPKAQISVDKVEALCNRDTFRFSDYSVLSDNGVSWNWSFPGATYVSSNTERQPKVVYGVSGMYDVKLTVSDAHGTDSMILMNHINVEAFCDADTFPGQALKCTNPGDFGQGALNLTTVNMTISAWVKPDGIQPDFSGIYFGSGENSGLNFKDNNQLGYHWKGDRWFWNSGLVVPADVWSHVAMVVNASGTTLYLNGVASTDNSAHTAANINQGFIGSYLGQPGRNFKGEIDEIAVWKRSLSEAEIRELMHITRDKIVANGPSPDPDLYAYFQFNEPSGTIIYDRSTSRNATIAGGATRVTSTAPVGGGSASTINISTTGFYDFPDENIRLVTNQAGSLPGGDVVVSHIKWAPNEQPYIDALNNNYWAIHSFGPNATFVVDSIYLNNSALTSSACEDIFVFDRPFNAYGNSWGSANAIAEECNGAWFKFPSDTFNKTSQLAIGHYTGGFYVDSAISASIDGNGASWATAFPDLQTAVNYAHYSDSVFIAKGTYYPSAYERDCTGCSSPRKFTFEPRESTVYLGGFPTGGGSLASRNWTVNKTILSGDRTGVFADRVYHVLSIEYYASNIIMDGLYIKNGLANGPTASDQIGSAMIALGQATLSNIEFSDNQADESILYLYGSQTEVLMKKCMARNNTTGLLHLDVDEGAQLLLDTESDIEN